MKIKLQSPLICKTIIVAFCDDNMVKQGNVQEFSCFGNLLGNLPVGF